MGKAVVIHYEEFSSNRHNTPLLADLFEITTKGLKNVSHKIYGNVGGENIVLSGTKPYLLVVAGTSGIGSIASRKSYGAIWYDRPMEKPFKEHLMDELICSEVSSRWIKNTYARGANKNDFYVEKYCMDKYSELSSSLVFSITKPVNMSTEDFNELLELYGGRENFDVRQVLTQYLEDYLKVNTEVVPKYSNLVSYLLQSKSYILPSPIYITNDQVPGLLHIVKKLLVPWDGPIVPELYVKDSLDTDSCKLYSSMSSLLRTITCNILDPERFIWLLKKYTDVFPSKNLSRDPKTPFRMTEERGTYSLPKITKLSVPEDRIPTSVDASPYSITKNSERILELYTKLDPNSIDYSLLESYIYSLHRLCTVFNSTTYLSRELYKVIEMDLNNSIRWKGSRKEAEVYFGSFVYTLKCILKSPKVFKYLLSRAFLNEHGSTILGRLHILGESIEKITGRKSTFSLPESLKDSLGTKIMYSNSIYGKSHFISLAHTYLINNSNKNGLILLESLVEYLEKTTEFEGVKNSIENGTQVTSSGCLLKVNYPSYTSVYLQNTLFSKDLLKKLANKEVDGLIQRSALSDIHFLCEYFRTLEFSEKRPFKYYILRICDCITILSELKNCVSLKSAESYFLSSTANDYLNHSKWTSLLD